MNRYLTQWFLATALILLVVAAINVVVDPYGIFRLVDRPGLNSVKPTAASRGPMAKAYQVLRVQPKTLILGNSRAEVGLDPNHPAWPQTARPVYNAALPGTGTATSLRYLQHVLAATAGNPTAQPTLVLWGVDFMDFLTDPAQPTPPRNAHAGDSENRRLMQASAIDRLRQQVRDYADSTLTLSIIDTCSLHAQCAQAANLFTLYRTDGAFRDGTVLAGWHHKSARRRTPDTIRQTHPIGMHNLSAPT